MLGFDELSRQFLADVQLGDLALVVTPANSTPAPTAAAWSTTFTVNLKNGGGEIQKWFNGKIPIAVTDDSSAGTSSLARVTEPDDYESNKTYHRGDLVTYGGSVYSADVTTAGNLPTDTDYWTVESSIAYVDLVEGVGYMKVCGDAAAWLNAEVVTVKFGSDSAGTEIFGKGLTQISRTITFTTA